ncbi:MAG: hypothetical protein Q8Q50_00340 [Methylobacter sp.]|nr:hypothetical protein [Methylobacter sp.]
MRSVESRRTGRQIVVGDGDLRVGDGEVVVSAIRAAEAVADHAPVRAFADRIVIRRDGDGLRRFPVGGGEGHGGDVGADLVVGVVQGNDDIGRGLAVQHYGISVGSAALGDGGVAVRWRDADADGRTIQEKQRVAAVIAHQGFQVAVAVEVGKGGAGQNADIAQAVGVGNSRGKGGAGRATRVQEQQRVAVGIAHPGIQVAVAVEVGKGGAGHSADIAQAEGVGDGRGKSGAGGAAGVQEKQRAAGVIAHQDIQVAVGIDIGQGGAGRTTDIAQTKGVGLRSVESRRTGRQIVVDDGDLRTGDGQVVVSAIRTADAVTDHAPVLALAHRVVIRRDGDGLRSVPVGAGEGQGGDVGADLVVGVVQGNDDVGRGRGVQHYGISVGRAALGDGGVAIRWRDADAGGRTIQEQQRIAVFIAHEGIQVAVAVDVGKGRGGIAPTIAQAVGVGDGRGKRGAGRAAGILEKPRVAGVIAHEGIQVAVAIDVGKGGAGIRADIAQAEGIGDGGGKDGAACAAGVLEKQRVAESIAHEGIEVAVAVDVGQGGGGKTADIAQAKGVGDGRGKRGTACAARVLEKQRVAVIIAH